MYKRELDHASTVRRPELNHLAAGADRLVVLGMRVTVDAHNREALALLDLRQNFGVEQLAEIREGYSFEGSPTHGQR